MIENIGLLLLTKHIKLLEFIKRKHVKQLDSYWILGGRSTFLFTVRLHRVTDVKNIAENAHLIPQNVHS